MNFFEFLPLIIILGLQFLYQFQKAAKRRAAKKGIGKEKSRSSREISPEKTPNNSLNSLDPESDLEIINEKTANRYSTPIYQEFFQDTFNFPPSFSNQNKKDEENRLDDELAKEKEGLINSNEERLESSLEEVEVPNEKNIFPPLSPVIQKKSFKKNLVYLLKNNSKRAIVLNEILGKPKF